MRSFRLRRAAVGSAVIALAIVSCLRTRPPEVKPGASLGVGTRGAAQRRHGPFAVVYAGPREKAAPMEGGAVTVLFNRSMRTFEAADDAVASGQRDPHQGGPGHPDG